MTRILLPFAAGALVGGIVGGIAGYVINDLTSIENEEVVAQQQADAARQADFEAFLSGLPAPAAGSGAGTN
jgi:gas vesicle protein